MLSLPSWLGIWCHHLATLVKIQQVHVIPTVAHSTHRQPYCSRHSPVCKGIHVGATKVLPVPVAVTTHHFSEIVLGELFILAEHLNTVHCLHLLQEGTSCCPIRQQARERFQVTAGLHNNTHAQHLARRMEGRGGEGGWGEAGAQQTRSFVTLT